LHLKVNSDSLAAIFNDQVGILMDIKLDRISVFAAVALLGGFTSLAFAEPPTPVAKLAQIEGKVMVNMGTTYALASPGTLVYPGAKVVTTRGSSVALVYQDGCIKRLKENSILTVGLASECSANKASERVYVAEAVGDTETDAGAGSTGDAAADSSSGKIVAGSVAAAVVLCITQVICDTGGDNNNASAQ
jgi:hypothetical protein